jgi:hypothetical protein
MLAKAWRRREDGIYLYKSGTVGFANAGKEPYSEFYSAQIAELLGFDHTPYDLEVWKDMRCSTCKLWTSIGTSFIPIGQIVTKGGFKAVAAYYTNLGERFLNGLKEMLVFDALTVNEDRHYGNFGLLIDSHTNTPIAPAPLFDNGLSLLWGELDADLSDYQKAVKTRLPKVYDDYIGTAQRFMIPADRDNLRKLKGFRFRRHPRHNLAKTRLIYLEQMIQEQLAKFLS